MSEQRNRKRIRERLALKLPVRVSCRETADFEWVEVTRLIDVTPYGAGFKLKHPTEEGRLLHLTIPMPRQLRVFDHVEDQYKIWAVVRYVRSSTGEHGEPLFDVGVAFIGKRAPKSYDEDPTRRYQIAGSSAEALVAVGNIDDLVKPPPTSDQRAHTRHNIPVDVLLQLLDKKGDVAFSENTVTENISRKGATVFTTLHLSVGRFVRLSSGQIVAHAAVRSVSTGAGGVPRIHVEFIDKEWPL